MIKVLLWLSVGISSLLNTYCIVFALTRLDLLQSQVNEHNIPIIILADMILVFGIIIRAGRGIGEQQ